MLTREFVIEEVRAGRRTSECFDGRDFQRLVEFMPVEAIDAFGCEAKEPKAWKAEEWSEANVLKWLKSDVAFAFTKALDKRGLSAGLMHDVIKMWLWILEEEIPDCYEQYGLPLFKHVALKFDFPNPIGEDVGSEQKYASDAE